MLSKVSNIKNKTFSSLLRLTKNTLWLHALLHLHLWTHLNKKNIYECKQYEDSNFPLNDVWSKRPLKATFLCYWEIAWLIAWLVTSRFSDPITTLTYCLMDNFCLCFSVPRDQPVLGSLYLFKLAPGSWLRLPLKKVYRREPKLPIIFLLAPAPSKKARLWLPQNRFTGSASL